MIPNSRSREIIGSFESLLGQPHGTHEITNLNCQGEAKRLFQVTEVTSCVLLLGLVGRQPQRPHSITWKVRRPPGCAPAATTQGSLAHLCFPGSDLRSFRAACAAEQVTYVCEKRVFRNDQSVQVTHIKIVNRCITPTYRDKQ